MRDKRLTGFDEKAEKNVDENATAESSANSQQIMHAILTAQDEDAALYLEGLKGNHDQIEGERLEGNCNDIITKLAKEYETNIPLHGEVMVLDSFDGARHMSLISFSSQVCGKSTLSNNSFTSSSFNILT